MTLATLTVWSELLQTPTGPVIILTDEDDRVRALDWQSHEHRLWLLFRRRYGAAAVRPRDAASPSAARRALAAYFDGDMAALDELPVTMPGTPFQCSVWAALRDIPVGRTLSYGALAARIGRPNAVRAVGLANGANPIPIIVPCHRVIGADASLTGFGGGLERKRWLLAHEGVRLAPRQGELAIGGTRGIAAVM